MKATKLLDKLGQSLWLDNITRDLIDSGTLKRYIDEFSVTGLTSNPTIFEQAIKNSKAYDSDIRTKLAEGNSAEQTFFELALADLVRASDLFRPMYEETSAVDGWVSLEVSPLLAHDTAATIAAAKELFARAGRPNLIIKIPGTKESLPAIEEAIYLSDRIWVLSRRPSQIIQEVKINFPRPRHQVTTRAEGRFMEIRNDIYRQIGNQGTW